jgi:hypothetical protein
MIFFLCVLIRIVTFLIGLDGTPSSTIALLKHKPVCTWIVTHPAHFNSEARTLKCYCI